MQMKLQVAELDQRFRSDPELETLIKHWTARVGLRLGDDSYVLEIDGGRVRGFAAHAIDDTQLRLTGTDGHRRPHTLDQTSANRFDGFRW